jgi:diguanylate cyclase (GGDEF)-like protein
MDRRTLTADWGHEPMVGQSVREARTTATGYLERGRFKLCRAAAIYVVDMRMSIRSRLLGAFGVMIVLMLVGGLFAVDRLGQDNRQLSHLATTVVPGTRTVGDVNALMNKYRKDQLHYILARPADRPGAAGISGDLSGDVSSIGELLGSYQSSGLLSGPVDRRLLISFRSDFARYVTITAPFQALADAGQVLRAGEVIGDGAGDAEYNQLKSIIERWLNEKLASANAAASAGRSGYHASVALILALLAAGVVVALGVAIVLANRITRAVRAIGQAASAISEGQLVPAAAVFSRDELGDLAQNFDGLVAYLSNTVAVAQAIADGDIDSDPCPTGEHDTLGHALVTMTQSLRRVRHDLLASEDNLRTVARVARGLPNHDNPRQAICDAAREIAHADIVQLWEPDGHAHLTVTAMAGAQISPELRVAIDGETSGTVIAYQSRQRRVVLDTHARGAAVSVRIRELLGVASALYEPVLGHNDTLGVLVVLWKTAITDTQDREVEAVGLLAAEAAVAIQRADLTAQLTSLARKDPLTGLDNRRVWDEEFPCALRRAHRSREPVCVAIADLDHFKAFNDGHGHQAGDQLLRAVARSWQSCLRDTDLLARYGGEEFAIILPNANLHQAAQVLDRLRQATPDEQTCSIGLAEWDGTESAHALLARADTHVYEAKTAGRNRVAVAVT